MEKHTCDHCKRNFARRDSLIRHQNRINQYDVSNDNNVSHIDVITSKYYEKKVGGKQPYCDEIIHFSSNEFKDSEPKSLETWSKLNELVNKELSLEKKLVWELMLFLLLLQLDL